MIVIHLLLILFKRTSCIDPLVKDLLTPSAELGERCGYSSCPNIREGWINVHIVPYNHAELGFMKTFSNYYSGDDHMFAKTRINMKQILDVTISELWANKQRRFTIADSELPYFFYWWSRRDGTVRRMVYELIRQGRLVIIGGGWGMQDEATTYYQTIIDSYTYSLRKINATFLGCGRPLVAWQADTFGHSREYASLMALMGFDGLFINPISFDDELVRMERQGLEFVWRGSDDLGPVSDIYTHKLFDGYWSPPGFCFSSLCSDPLLITSDTAFYNVDERVKLFIDSIRFRQAPNYRTNQVMVMMGHKMSYFDGKMWFENIETLMGHVNKEALQYKMHAMYSNPICYLQAVFEENPILETKQDDFFPYAYNKDTYMTGMYTSRPTFKYLVREANVFLQIAKQLQVLADLGNNGAIFEEFMWIMGVAQDHNVITGAMRPYAQSYYTKLLYVAIQKSTAVLKQGFNKIRASPYRADISLDIDYMLCYLNESSCPNSKVAYFYIMIYNPLAWNVTTAVRIPIGDRKYDVFDPSGKTVPSVSMTIPDHVLKIPNRLRENKYELVFIAKELPALGYRSYYIKEKTRNKRSLIKKISKNQQKKYFIRQIPHSENKTLFEERDEEYYDDEQEAKIEFGNITKKGGEGNEFDVVTPRKEIAAEEVTEETGSDSSTETVAATSKTTTTTEKITTKPRADYKETRTKQTEFYYEPSEENFIENRYIRINLDSYRKVSDISLSNGINTSLDIQYYYYVSDNPDPENQKRQPGAYVFRPVGVKPNAIIDFVDTKVYKSELVEEIHSKYSDFASFVLRLYKDSVVCEIDWTLGAIPEDDGLGKEIFMRYTTGLKNDGVFYTDANGRQMMKRIRYKRAMYEPYNLDVISGNFYPVTSRIYIEDLNENIRLSVFNDRSQGGSSLLEGAIDLMLNRHIFTDDSGVQTFLNDTGLIVRGTHYLYLTKADHRPNRVFERRLAKEIELKPQILFSRLSQMMEKDAWSLLRNEYSGLKSKLPVGVHLLTLQEWNARSLLIRLENYLEKVDLVRSGVKEVHLKDIFADIRPRKAVEMTLAANMLLKDWSPVQWQKNNSFVKNFNRYYGSDEKIEYNEDKLKLAEEVDIDHGLLLRPQQIRTFVVFYDYMKRNKF